MINTVKCRICNNDNNNNEYIVDEMLYGTNHSFQYFQCSECHCLQIKAPPLDIENYYPADTYYSYNPKKENKLLRTIKDIRNKSAYSKKGFIGNTINYFFSNNAISALSKANKESKILDVGCGSGSFLIDLKKLGFNKITGIDPFNKEYMEKEGIKIHNCSINEIGGKWDIITFNHSFEHILAQRETLKTVKKLLTPNGVCIIRIPTVSSLAWNIYKEKWVQLDAPRHFFLHSIESMEKLCQDSNLIIETIQYDSTSFQFSGSEKYKGNLASSKKLSVLEKLCFIQLSKILNNMKLGDQAAFYIKNAP